MNAPTFNSQQLLIRICFPHPAVELVDPLGRLVDSVAGDVLTDLIRLELSAAGLLVQSGAASPNLSRGILRFEVSDTGAAAHLVLLALARNKLKRYATLFQFDDAEEVWRSFYPQAGADILTDELRNQIEREQARNTAALEMREKELSKLQPPTDEHPGQ